MRVAARRAWIVGLLLVGAAACGSSSPGGNDDAGIHPGQPDASPTPGTPDAGPTGGFTEAPHMAPGLMVYGGDRLLLNPKVITITFPNESMRATYEAFGDAITTTTWWDQVTGGYCDSGHHCIGHGSNGGHVHLTSAPSSSYTDSPAPGAASTIKDFIKARVADGSFPVPDVNTLYVIYFPTSVTVTLSQGSQTATSCQQFGGYHTFVNVTSPATSQMVAAAYAIIPHCNALIADPIETSSHEIIEATTDPLVSDVTANGYYMDQTRDAWLAITAAEVGDVCALLKAFSGTLFGAGPEVYTESGYGVQRSFSNTSTAAGHNPCLPASGVYFNVAPAMEKLVMHTGDSKVIELTGFSDAATSDWQVSVMDMGALTNPFAPKVLNLTLDRATANNGTKLHLTIQVQGTVDPTNGAPYVIVSKSGSNVSFWPGIVEAQ